MCTWGHGVRKFHLCAFLTPPKVPFRAIGEKKGTKHTTPKVSILGRLTSSGEFLQQFFAIFSKKPFLYFFLRSLWMGLLGGLKIHFWACLTPQKSHLGKPSLIPKKIFTKWWPPPVPLLWSPYLFIFPSIFLAKKEMILKVVWWVFGGCYRVFEVCLTIFGHFLQKRTFSWGLRYYGMILQYFWVRFSHFPPLVDFFI